jgi:hypothetical protein
VRVPDGDGRVVGQAAECRLVPVGEGARGAIEDVEETLELAVLDGDDDLRDNAGGLDPVGVLPGDPRILGSSW